jgi:hypothetical protein
MFAVTAKNDCDMAAQTEFKLQSSFFPCCDFGKSPPGCSEEAFMACFSARNFKILTAATKTTEELNPLENETKELNPPPPAFMPKS